MYYDTAKEIWDVVKETYSNIDNTFAIFEIKSLLHDLQQGEKLVTEFFNTLSRYWQQLIPTKCRNLPFGWRARRDLRVRLPNEKNARELPSMFI